MDIYFAQSSYRVITAFTGCDVGDILTKTIQQSPNAFGNPLFTFQWCNLTKVTTIHPSLIVSSNLEYVGGNGGSSSGSMGTDEIVTAVNQVHSDTQNLSTGLSNINISLSGLSSIKSSIDTGNSSLGMVNSNLNVIDSSVVSIISGNVIRNNKLDILSGGISSLNSAVVVTNNTLLSISGGITATNSTLNQLSSSINTITDLNVVTNTGLSKISSSISSTNSILGQVSSGLNGLSLNSTTLQLSNALSNIVVLNSGNNATLSLVSSGINSTNSLLTQISSVLSTANSLNTTMNSNLLSISSGIAGLGTNTAGNTYLAQISSTLGNAFATAVLNVDAVPANTTRSYSNVKSAIITAQPVLLATTLNTSSINVNGANVSLNSPITVAIPPNTRISNTLTISGGNLAVTVIYTT